MSPIDFQTLNATNNPYFMNGDLKQQQSAIISILQSMPTDQLVIMKKHIQAQQKQDERNYIGRTLKAAALGGLLGGAIGGKKWILDASIGLAGIANIIPAIGKHLANKNQGLSDDPITKDTFHNMKFGAIAVPIVGIIYKAITKAPAAKLVTWKNVLWLPVSAAIGTVMVPGISGLFDSAIKAIDKFSHKITNN